MGAGVVDRRRARLWQRVRWQRVRYDGARHDGTAQAGTQIDRYLIAAGSRPVFIAEICETFKVRRRSLYRAFNDVMGIPPITYLRRKRLVSIMRGI